AVFDRDAWCLRGRAVYSAAVAVGRLDGGEGDGASLSPVSLRSKRPELVLALTVSKATTVAVRLLDARLRPVASWSRTTHQGKNTLELLLPNAARKTGRDTVEISARGSTIVRVVHVLLGS